MVQQLKIWNNKSHFEDLNPQYIPDLDNINPLFLYVKNKWKLLYNNTFVEHVFQ